METSIYNAQGEVVGSVELDQSVFGVPVNEGLMHQAVVKQLANARVGTAASKTRANVNRTTAKLFKQKGTGRARQGSKSGPHWTGGGVAFGPHPRDHSVSMPKKMRRQAVRCALSSKVQEQHLIVLDAIPIEQPRTKAMVSIMRALGIEGKSALVALESWSEGIVKSARNIPGVGTACSDSLNVVDLLRHDYLVIPVGAVKKVERDLGTAAT